MRDITHGVRHLHCTLKICHRDIKPANILVQNDNDGRGPYMKIGDFGLARNFPESTSAISATGNVGTAGWSAPEIFRSSDGNYHFPVDIFSLGLVFLAMLKHQLGHHLQSPPRYVTIILTLIIPCGVNLTLEDHFDGQHKNHQHHSSEILWLCQAIYCNVISGNVFQFHAWMTSVQSNMCSGPIGPRQIIAVQPLNKKFKCFFSYKLNVRTGFLDPEKMGKDTKFYILSQILRTLWGNEYLAHLAQTPFHVLLIWQKSCLRVLE